jgi:hypothetical protein
MIVTNIDDVVYNILYIKIKNSDNNVDFKKVKNSVGLILHTLSVSSAISNITIQVNEKAKVKNVQPHINLANDEVNGILIA